MQYFYVLLLYGCVGIWVSGACGLLGAFKTKTLFTGADIDAEDESGATALTIAARFGHKTCERHLFLFRWQQRAKRTKPSAEPARMAHQYYDSSFPVWKRGNKCQVYFMNILPPGEYEGTRFNSPKRITELSEDEIEELESIGRGT